MKLSPQSDELLQAWQRAAGGAKDVMLGVEGATWERARRTYIDELEAVLPVPDGVRVEDSDMGGVPAIVVVPDGGARDRDLFYMHGGGYVNGAASVYRGLAGHLALRLGARVHIPDYRQAPEYPFPTPVDDVFRAYRSMFEAGLDPARVAICGDSAGGALVVTTMRKARDAGVPLPLAGVAFSPWADLGHAGPSARSRDGLDPLNTVPMLDLLARTFLGDALTSHSDASPVYADVHGLAPILIQMGENEVMLSGGVRLAERLAEQRVRTTLEVWPGMFHVWQIFAGQMPEADEALDNAVAFLSREYDRADR